MRSIATASGEVVMHIHTNEYPRVAHIVADLDEVESDMDLDLPLGVSAKMMFDVRRTRPSMRRTVMQSAVSLGLVLLATACASTGATFRSRVDDAFLEKAPYYAGASAASVSARVANVTSPIAVDAKDAVAPDVHFG